VSAPHDPRRAEPRTNLTELEPELRERLLALDEPVARADWHDVLRQARVARPWTQRVVPLVAAATGVFVAAAVASVVLGVWSDGGRPPSIGGAAPTLRHGSHMLYVTASEGGGFCYRWSGVSDDCDQLTSAPLSVQWTSDEVVGTVSSHRISSVRIAFTDGSEADVPVAWIASPVNAGFIFFTIPAGKTVAAVSGFSGHHVTRRVTWFSV
jgi:hypothetical protein